MFLGSWIGCCQFRGSGIPGVRGFRGSGAGEPPSPVLGCQNVARGVGQFSLLTLCSASFCYAGPKLQVTVWQDVMTTLVVRMGLWSGEEGLFIGQPVEASQEAS